MTAAIGIPLYYPSQACHSRLSVDMLIALELKEKTRTDFIHSLKLYLDNVSQMKELVWETSTWHDVTPKVQLLIYHHTIA
jgi:hypothetical protein